MPLKQIINRGQVVARLLQQESEAIVAFIDRANKILGETTTLPVEIPAAGMTYTTVLQAEKLLKDRGYCVEIKGGPDPAENGSIEAFVVR